MGGASVKSARWGSEAPRVVEWNGLWGMVWRYDQVGGR